LRPFDPDPSLTRLFCLTHPDDEVAVAAWMRRLVRAGAPVWMSWTHRTEIREREARTAAAEIGVPDERLVFHAGTDGRVCEQMAELRPAFSAMMERIRPDAVYCCAFEQGHLDHDATHRLITATFYGPVLEFPMYHTYRMALQVIGRFADPAGQEVLELTQEERAWKFALLDRYPSQRIKRIVKFYQRIGRLIGRDVDLDSSERLRLWDHRDYASPNLPPKMAAKVERSSEWRRWLEALRAFEALPAP
jgi:LmbE family N-acetylglucosaminyl deacetylase